MSGRQRNSKRRTSEQIMPGHQLRAWCENCGKHGYFARAHAKDERQRLRREDRRSDATTSPLSIYPCPQDPTRWHIGHDHARAAETAGYYQRKGAS